MERPCILDSSIVFSPPYPDTLLHAASVGWLQARREHLPSKPPFADKQMLYPSLCSTPWHAQTQSLKHTRSEYATRFITIKVSPKGIETHQPFREQPWTLADLLFVTSSTWQNKNGYSPNTWKGLLLMLPTSSALPLSGWNKPSQLSSQDNKPKIPWSNLKHKLICWTINA